MKHQLLNQKASLLFIGLILFMTWFYGIFDTMNRGPYSQHQWRQADCLSITQHYYQDDLPFLEPQIHWQGGGEVGKSISEFPIVYYSVAKMWQWFGKHYWVYRLLNYTIVFLGLIYLKKLSKKILGSDFWATFIPLFLFTSPVLTYYSNNFLMNANALSLALIACYQFYLYFTEKSLRHLYYACAIFLLAGLLKITSLLLFIALGAIFLYTVFWKERSFKQRWKEFIPYVLVVIGIYTWYSYAAQYNAKNLGIFLQGLLPIWELNSEEIAETWFQFHNHVFPEFFNTSIFFVVLIMFGVLLVNYKRINTGFRAVLILTSAGVMSYFLLFYQVFNVHEYYLTNLLVIIPLILIVFLHFLKTNYPATFFRKLTKIIAIFMLVISAYYARIRTIIKYDVGSPWLRTSLFITEEERKNWQYYHWSYKRTFKDLETIEPYLEELGIEKSDKVISLPDPSINVSLYLMNRDGYCDYGYPDQSEAERIESAKDWGAKYLVVNNYEILNEEYLQPYLEQKIGETEFVSIYQIAE